MNWRTNDLDELLGGIWRALKDASGEPSHPFRTGTLVTGVELELGARVVVLRGVDREARRLSCFTDARTPKVRHIRKNPEIQWVFHDPAARVQIRAGGSAVVHHRDDTAREAWRTVPAMNRLNYASKLAPGNRLAGPDDALPVEWRGSVPEAGALEFAFENFAVVNTTVDHFDWMVISAEGNRRAGFMWVENQFRGGWLVA